MSLSNSIRTYTEQLRQRDLLRTRRLASATDSQLLHFDSNDYLSLSQDKRIAQAYVQGYKHSPCASGGSMVLGGYHAAHQHLERAFAELLEVDDCLLFSSGYAANLAITALLGRIKAHCIIDKGVHASIYDGIVLAQLAYSRFIHNDMTDVAKILQSCDEDAVVITEGIFSMSGQTSPLAELAALCSPKEIPLIIDEAHSFGVIGDQGRGAVSLYHLRQESVPLRMIPLGKAFAAQGAVVAGQSAWIQALIQVGRSFVYSTAMSPALAYGLLKTLEILVNAEDRRIKLQHLIAEFRQQAKSSSLDWGDSHSPIQQLRLGCPHKALHFAHELQRKGICCSAVRPPTVPLKYTGLRIVLNYQHSPEQIRNLFKQLECINEYKPA